ncbi:uncharacterized protein LOC119667112 [Teleopsis dalmanni]|uniref:uncharacterized protein LOC119667112 n=1 Tax=Teleopsis dalmanni TaxID=139649 RepID=UPI0018CDAFFC|nr:uncharacterized protein LOC119667112 [Teleopsis dalmanni]
MDNVLNTVVMFEDLDGSIVFYTYKLFGAECWKDIVLSYSNKYENGVLMRNYLFPRRLQNFYKCELRVCVYESPPFTQIKGDKNKEIDLLNLNRLSGIEGDLLKILAEKLNFSVRLTISEEFGIIGTESNSTGCFALLENDTVDIAIGGFSSALTHYYLFSSSYTYYDTKLIFVIRMYWSQDHIKKLLYPFENNVCETIQIFIFGDGNQRPVLNMVIVFLGFSLDVPPKRNFARFLVMLWLIVTLLMRSSYQGKLFDVLRFSIMAQQLEAIEELIEQQCLLFAPAYVEYYPRNLTVPIDGTAIERFDMVNTYYEKKRIQFEQQQKKLDHFRNTDIITQIIGYDGITMSYKFVAIVLSRLFEKIM